MDWTRLHLALNHLPVVGIPFLVLLLGWGWARSRPEITRLALWWIVWFVPLGIALKFTGDEAAEASATRLAAEKTWVEQHEQAADQAATGLFVLGLAAAGTLVLGRRERPLPGWAVVVTLVAGVGTAVLLARTAHAGGKIGHPELRAFYRVPAGAAAVQCCPGGASVTSTWFSWKTTPVGDQSACSFPRRAGRILPHQTIFDPATRHFHSTVEERTKRS